MITRQQILVALLGVLMTGCSPRPPATPSNVVDSTWMDVLPNPPAPRDVLRAASYRLDDESVWRGFVLTNNYLYGIRMYTNGTWAMGTWPMDFHSFQGVTGSQMLASFGSTNNGLLNGRGIALLPENRWYVGEFMDGKPTGFGSMWTLGGNQYVGMQTNGVPHGDGAYWDWENLKGTYGLWVDGVCVLTNRIMKPDKHAQPGH